MQTIPSLRQSLAGYLRSIPGLGLEENEARPDETPMGSALSGLREDLALKSFYESILDHLPAAVVTLAPPDFRIVHANDSCSRFVEDPTTPVIGRPITEIAPFDQIEGLAEVLRGVVATGELACLVDLEIDGLAQGLIYWSGRVVPVRDDRAHVTHLLVTLVETTRRKRAEETLRKRHEEILALNQALDEEKKRLEAVLEAVGDPVDIVGPDFRLVWANKAFADIYGDVTGKLCYQEFKKKDEVCLGCPVAEVFRTGEKASAISHSYGLDGHEFWAEVTATPLRDASGTVVAVVEALHGLADREALDDEMLQRNKELEALNAVAGALSGPLALEDVVDLALEKAMGVLGIETGSVRLLDQAAGELRLFAHKGFSEKYISKVLSISATQGVSGCAIRSGEVVLVDELGPASTISTVSREEGLESGASIPLKFHNRVIGVLNLFSRQRRRFHSRDLKLLSSIGSQVGVAIENARLFGELSETTEDARLKALQLQSVLARDFNAQEEERKRIARDIHDGIAQLISGALRQIESTTRDGKSDVPKNGLRLAEELLRQALDEVGATLFHLSPPIMELRLVAALQKYLALCRATFGLSCHLHTSGAAFHLCPPVETAIYRIVQEAIQNVAKHTQATDANVFLEFTPTRLRVTVQDNGGGAWEEDGSDEWHLGLISMRERVLSVGGRMEIANFPGYGSKLTLDVPSENDPAGIH